MAYFLLHSGQPSAKRLLRRIARLSAFIASNTLTAQDVVIRWGPTTESDPPECRILNPHNAVERTTSRSSMGKLLRRVGIRFPVKSQLEQGNPDSIRFVRQYRIPIFDMVPLSCFRADTSQIWIAQRMQRLQDTFREVALDDDKVTTRAVYLAMRALHALGLDSGMVSVGMAPKGILHVLDVTPNPILEGRLLELYVNAIESMIDREEQPQNSGPIMIGTDIELMLRNAQGKMVLASNYFSRKGPVGCDDRSIQFDGKRLPLLELRPEPDTSPLGLLDNLKTTMVHASYGINRAKVEWRAGSMPFRPYCTGGHIHLSNVPLTSHFVRALDNYVGLPLMMVEDQRTAQLRRPRYGFLGDVRQKSYGGFEYRTPASFVVHPDVTAAAVCLAYIVALHANDLPVADIYDLHTQGAFYQGDTDDIYPIVERNFTNLRQLSIYERYRDYIEPLYNMIRSGKIWDESVDVRIVWGIPLEKPTMSRVARRRRLTNRVTQ